MKAPAAGRLLNIARIRADPGWRVELESHHYHQWLIVCQGRSFVRIDGQEFAAAAGQCLFFAQGRKHTEWTDPHRPHESYGLCFTWKGPTASLPVCVADSPGRMRVLAGWLTTEWTRHSPDSALLRHHYFQGMLAEWLRLTQDRQHALVTQVRAHIRAHVGEPLGLDDLAGVTGLSRCHFSRLYHRLAGRSVSDDLRALRLEYAQGLLMSTDMPIKDVATRAGLTDQHYLTRLFRKHLNVTPGELRRCRPAKGVVNAG